MARVHTRIMDTTKKNGSRVLYRGPSMYDPNVTIRVVATFQSGNTKTGAMTQTHILVDGERPAAVVREKRDGAVCGSCPFAGGAGCYVVTGLGPTGAWKGSTEKSADLEAGCEAIRAKGSPLRLGSYGDPAALPDHVVARMVASAAEGWTGYTHGWRKRPDLASSCMASVETAEGAREAWALGFRTYRVRAHGSPLLPGEIDCPSNRGVKCADCLLCDGKRGESDKRRSVSIEAHGTKGATKRALRVVE